MVGRLWSRRSRVAILDAALALCREQGYANVTIEAIAARAGVGKQTIYRWWPSKGAVVLDAFGRVSAAANPLRDTGDIVADMRAFVTKLAAKRCLQNASDLRRASGSCPTNSISMRPTT